jgi:Ca2+-binding EF-hand superfamily protein
MANEVQKQEIDDKVTALVATRYGGDYRAAFAHYDTDGNGTIDKVELKALLKDAGVGSGLTRWAWAKGIMDAMDSNGDGAISWAEFEAVFRATSPEVNTTSSLGRDEARDLR